ncbi:MAG: YggT family protein [Pseudomonadales bacterium]
MNASQEILSYIIQTLGGLYVFFALLRVLLQASHADYYNPVSQFAVKITQKPVWVLSKIIPRWGRLDLAGILWVLIVQILIIEVSCLIFYSQLIDPVTALAWAAIGTFQLFLTIVFWGMIILIIMSFAALLGGMRVQHPILTLIEQLMAPIMYPLQRILPPMGGIDLSPLLLFMVISILQIVTANLAQGTGLAPSLVIGF